MRAIQKRYAAIKRQKTSLLANAEADKEEIVKEIQKLEAQIFFRKIMTHFTDIIELYDSVEGNINAEENTNKVNALTRKYMEFKRNKLDMIIDDMKRVRSITKSMLDKKGCDDAETRCSLQYWLLRVYRFHRYIFVSTYYYIVPFLILVFQTILLYSHEIYSQYLFNKQ